MRNEWQILAIQGLDYVVKTVSEMEQRLRTVIFQKNEYLSKMAKVDSDYQFLKEVMQNNLWKRYRNDGRMSHDFSE